MTGRAIMAAGVAMTLAVSSVAAQSSSTPSPADVAREFFAAERDGRWLDAARLLDLKSFEAQRARSVANARMVQPVFHVTVEQVLRHDPKMPRAVAEYQVKQMEARRKDFDPLAYEYADVPNADSLAALPIDVDAARWLEARDPRWQMKKQNQSLSSQCTQLSESKLKEVRKGLEDEIASMIPSQHIVAVAAPLPSVPGAADSVSYVLFRDLYEQAGDSAGPTRTVSFEMMSPSVLALKQTLAGWRVLPSEDLGRGSWGYDFDCAVDPVKPKPKKK